MTNLKKKNHYTAVLRWPGVRVRTRTGPRSRSDAGPGPGPEFAGPGPEVRVQGPQKQAGPDLDRTLDSLLGLDCIIRSNAVPSDGTLS